MNLLRICIRTEYYASPNNTEVRIIQKLGMQGHWCRKFQGVTGKKGNIIIVYRTESGSTHEVWKLHVYSACARGLGHVLKEKSG